MHRPNMHVLWWLGLQAFKESREPTIPRTVSKAHPAEGVRNKTDSTHEPGAKQKTTHSRQYPL